MNYENKSKQVLLVEDNEGDIVLTLDALNGINAGGDVNVVKDGEEALEFLYKQGRFKEAKTPDIILLDINLPRIDGKEVLKKIKTDSRLMQIPVVMLTTSNSAKDIAESYQHHANCYITKPTDQAMFKEAMQEMKKFWFSIVQLPKN